MKRIGIYESTINRPDKTSRTTVPLPVVQALGLTNKDVILWEIFVDQDREILAIVKKKASQHGAEEGASTVLKKGAKEGAIKGAKKP